jgi:quercetin dioxygenase-like cupin family protein
MVLVLEYKKSMERKRNEATLNRPEGDRVLDAAYVFIDIDDYIRQLREEDAWQKSDRNGITVYKTDQVTMVVVGLHEKAILKNNVIDGIVTMQVFEGRIRVTTPEGDIELKPNQIVTFHRCIDHSVEALDESVLLLTNNTTKRESLDDGDDSSQIL